MVVGDFQREHWRYFAAARQLEEALRQNKLDTEFAKGKGNEIVYVADTNVLVSYLEEGRKVRRGEFSFGDFLSQGVPAQVNDQLAMEYMLFGMLPGQQGPIYLTPPHWNEILERASETARRIERLQQTLPANQLNELRSVTDSRKRIELAQEILPDRIMEALKIASTFRRRLKEAFADEPAKLDALDRNRQYWPPAMNRIRTSDVTVWRKAIVKARRSLRQPQSAASHTKNLANDEVSLALLQALYRENPEACGNSRTVLFLFITADRGLGKAVEESSEALRADGIPMFVRHPRVFSPVLNFSSMSLTRNSGQMTDRAELHKVFEEVEHTLERLLVFDGSGFHPSRRVKHWHRARQELEASMECWSEAARQLAVSQAHFFRADSDIIRDAAELLGSPEGLRAASNALTETISSIRDRHVRFQSLEALRRVSGTIAKQKRRKVTVRRAPMQLIGVNLLEPVSRVIPLDIGGGAAAVGVSGFYDLLDHIGSTADSALLEKIGQELLARWEEPVAQLLAACLYLAVEAWPSARECAERCRKSVGPTTLLRREADYCFALASRFMLGSPGVYESANKVLHEHHLNFLTDKLPGATLGRLRYLVEHAALLSSASILQAIDDAAYFVSELDQDARILDADQITDSFGVADRLEIAARDRLDNDFSGELDGRDTRLVLATLKLQLFTNIVGTHLFKFSLGKRVSVETFRPDDLRSALARLKEECPGGLPRLTQVYIAVAQVILGPASHNVAIALTAIDEALRDADVSHGDQIEYRHLRDTVQLVKLTLGHAA